MSSTASTSSPSSSSTSVQEIRPQAGPLPAKRGEIGFQEEVHGQAQSESQEVVALPERHPADRDTPVTATGASNVNLSTSPTASVGARATIIVTPPTNTPSVTDSSSTRSTSKSRLIAFLSPKNVPSYGGFRLTTILAFVGQLLVLAGTIGGWAIATMRVNRAINSEAAPPDSDTQLNNATSGVFVHVIFGLLCLAELIFLERRLFRLRAERYSFLHPGEMLPSSHQRYNPSASNIGIAPWLRPPLPTYAAALAQSGHGTGDVEDHAIAVPPPPAYGNTRGSTLLLAGFLRDSLRAQRPRSQQSRMSQLTERPVSYTSRDEGWEEIRDADRARRLEETLSTLERPSTRQSNRR
jgi:hypothetical protein